MPNDFLNWIRLCEHIDLPRLFHGTRRSLLPEIQQHGLRAAKTNPKGGHIRHGIFLTDNYLVAHDFALLAIDRAGQDDEISILEIRTAFLDPRLLGPDDYELQDAIQGGEIPGSEPIDPRLAHLRHWYEADWRLSLAITHQVLYAGSIPPEAIQIL